MSDKKAHWFKKLHSVARDNSGYQSGTFHYVICHNCTLG
uniref:Uncharacterized protein n=1 Tax=Arundo donax TaxID=35708 RepID=A0A0A9FRW8_ARUDO